MQTTSARDVASALLVCVHQGLLGTTPHLEQGRQLPQQPLLGGLDAVPHHCTQT